MSVPWQLHDIDEASYEISQKIMKQRKRQTYSASKRCIASSIQFLKLTLKYHHLSWLAYTQLFDFLGGILELEGHMQVSEEHECQHHLLESYLPYEG